MLPKSTVAVNKPLAEKDPSTPDPQGTKHSEHGWAFNKTPFNCCLIIPPWEYQPSGARVVKPESVNKDVACEKFNPSKQYVPNAAIYLFIYGHVVTAVTKPNWFTVI